MIIQKYVAVIEKIWGILKSYIIKYLNNVDSHTNEANSEFKNADIYTHVYIYIYRYMHIYTYIYLRYKEQGNICKGEGEIGLWLVNVSKYEIRSFLGYKRNRDKVTKCES